MEPDPLVCMVTVAELGASDNDGRGYIMDHACERVGCQRVGCQVAVTSVWVLGAASSAVCCHWMCLQEEAV